MATWIKVTQEENIPSMGARKVIVADIEIAIFKTKDGSIFAVENSCPHKNGKLSEGLVHEHKVTCPLHNLDIELKSGQALEENGGCTKSYETKVENNTIYLLI